MRAILGIIFGVFLIMVVGSIIIQEFPALQPIVDKGSHFLGTAWNTAEVKYGTLFAGLIVIAIIFLLGDKKR